MENDPTILYVVIGLVAIMYLVLGILSFKTWRALHALTVMAIFLAIGYYAVLAAAYLKTDAVWRGQKHDPLKAEVDDLLLKVERLQTGIPFEDFSDSKRSLTAEIDREVLQRGRVWRGVEPGNLNGLSVTIDMRNWGSERCYTLGNTTEAESEEEPAEGGQPAQPELRPHNIQENMVVYAFIETAINELGVPPSNAQGGGTDDPASERSEPSRLTIHGALLGDSSLPSRDTEGYCKVPTGFIGEFEVTSASPAQITLQLNIPPDSAQRALLNQANATWVIFDSMPLDGHDIFVNKRRDKQGQEIITPMSEKEIRALVQPLNNSEAALEIYEELISQLLRDGKPIEEGGDLTHSQTLVQVISNPNPSAEDQAYLDAFSVVDSVREDGTVEPIDLSAPLYYNEQGQAVIPNILNESTIIIEPGRELLLPNSVAQEMIAHGWAEEIHKIFVRPLRDFSLINQNLYTQMERYDDNIAAMHENIARFVDSNEIALEIVNTETQTKEKLISDRDRFVSEQQAMQAHVGLLHAKKEELQTRIRALLSFNKAQAIRLEELTNQIEAAAQAATPPEEVSSVSSALPAS